MIRVLNNTISYYGSQAFIVSFRFTTIMAETNLDRFYLMWFSKVMWYKVVKDQI